MATLQARIHKAINIQETISRAQYLTMKAQLSGNLVLNGHKPSSQEKNIAEECRSLCAEIGFLLSEVSIAYVAELLECYNILFRISYGNIPDSDFISFHKHRIINAWESNDPSVEESSVYAIVAGEVKFHGKNADVDYVKVYNTLKDKWLATLFRHNYFPNANTYENYSRLALIMRENLNTYTSSEEQVKQIWYKHNRIDKLSNLGTTILRIYRMFVCSLFPAVLNSREQIELDNKILTELISRPDLNPFYRQTFTLSLQFNDIIIGGLEI